jgi:hypothetical protein
MPGVSLSYPQTAMIHWTFQIGPMLTGPFFTQYHLQLYELPQSECWVHWTVISVASMYWEQHNKEIPTPLSFCTHHLQNNIRIIVTRNTASQKIHIAFLWVKILCNLVAGYNMSEEHTAFIFYYEHWKGMCLENVGIKLPEDHNMDLHHHGNKDSYKTRCTLIMEMENCVHDLSTCLNYCCPHQFHNCP